MSEIKIKVNGTEYLCRSFFDITNEGGISGVSVYEVVDGRKPILLDEIINFELPEEDDAEDLELFTMKIGVWLNENDYNN